MPKRIVHGGIIVVREGQQVRPVIGKEFEFTADELKDIQNHQPNAVGKTEVNGDSDPAEIKRKEAEQTAKEAEAKEIERKAAIKKAETEKKAKADADKAEAERKAKAASDL